MLPIKVSRRVCACAVLVVVLWDHNFVWAQAQAAGLGGAVLTERRTPQVRSEAVAPPLTSALKRNLIEPFLVQPLLIDEAALLAAPRIVAAQENRVLLSRGDRAYARSSGGALLAVGYAGDQRFSVFREAKPLKDPADGTTIAYEAQFIGTAVLTGSETVDLGQEAQAGNTVPAVLWITGAKEEIRVGDRLMPWMPSQSPDLLPHPAHPGTLAQIISVYGSAAVNAAQNQVLVINRGAADGVEPGHVMAIQKRGALALDKGDQNRPMMQLPDERNGLAMVFLSFEKVAYALVVEVTDAVRVGDRLTAP